MFDRHESELHKLRGGVWPVLDEAGERERRERIAARVMAVQRELSARHERRRRWGLMLALAALVGGVGSLLFFIRVGPTAAPEALVPAAEMVRLVAGHASLREGTGLAQLAHGQLALADDALLVTPADESAELRLSSDTALRVSPSTEVGISRRRPAQGGFEERVRLRAGSVALQVPKLGTTGKVAVETRDALVEVHGTRFSVRVVEQPPLDSFTEVEVREGRVMVRSGEQSRFLDAGERWSSRREPVLPVDVPPVDVPPVEPTASVQMPHAPVRRARTAEKATPVVASELAAQNRLLESAELAQKGGMLGLALQRLDKLIERYPDAELAHNARVRRFRVLRLAGRPREAAAAAQAYLERHPDGFARSEAEQMIEELSSGEDP